MLTPEPMVARLAAMEPEPAWTNDTSSDQNYFHH